MQNIYQIISTSHLDLPAAEVFILVGILSIALLFRLPRCGLIAAYIFTYRWCWTVAASLPSEAQLVYIIFGVLVGALATVGMLSERHSA